MRIGRALAIAVMLLAAACGGGSDDPQPAATEPRQVTSPSPTTDAPEPSPTTVVPIATTSAPPAATTSPPPSTTTTQAPLDAQELLAAMNTAMARMPTFIGAGQGYIKATADTPNSEAFVTQLAVGGGPAGGDFWQLIQLEFDTPGLQQTFFVQDRTVGGVEYEQDPVTGVWSLQEESGPEPVRDAFSGSLTLADATAERTATGFRVTGGYPDDPDIDRVTVDIDGSTGRLRRIAVDGTVARSELAGFVDADGDPLVLRQQVDVTVYDLELPAIVAPPVGVATVLAPSSDGPFLTSIPADWVPMTAAQAAENGVELGFVGPGGITLLILTEDLSNSAIRDLGGYADALASFVFGGMELTFFDAVKTLQGRDAWVIAGRDPVLDFEFRRLVYLTPEGVGVNLTFAQGPDPQTGEPTTAWVDSRELLDFMVNGFLLNS